MRSPRPCGGTPILVRTGKRRSASRTDCRAAIIMQPAEIQQAWGSACKACRPKPSAQRRAARSKSAILIPIELVIDAFADDLPSAQARQVISELNELRVIDR